MIAPEPPSLAQHPLGETGVAGQHNLWIAIPKRRFYANTGFYVCTGVLLVCANAVCGVCKGHPEVAAP